MRYETYLEFDILMPLKIKSNGAVELPFCNFLLVSSSNHVSIFHRLAVMAPQTIFSLISSLAQNFRPLIHTYPRAMFSIFQKQNGTGSTLGERKGFRQKWSRPVQYF